jgi:hypothetical protein
MGIVELIGGILGAGGASFVASWAAFARPLKRQLDEQAALPTPSLPAPEVTGKDIDELKEEMRRGFDKLEHRCAAIETRQNTAVTSDEFSAYTSHTTQSVNQLTEKVGRVTGALETWTRAK